MVGNARQVNSQIESLSSHVERRLSQLFDVVNKNQTDFQEFRKILTTPLVQSRALPPDGLGLMSNGVGNVSPHPASGRNGQPWQENLSPPVASQPLSHQHGNGENLATTCNTHYKKKKYIWRQLDRVFSVGHSRRQIHVASVGPTDVNNRDAKC
ncbi:hypothetical protein LINPERPRIM_LOCUS26338 [Linum perenne]